MLAARRLFLHASHCTMSAPFRPQPRGRSTTRAGTSVPASPSSSDARDSRFTVVSGLPPAPIRVLPGRERPAVLFSGDQVDRFYLHAPVADSDEILSAREVPSQDMRAHDAAAFAGR